MAGERAFPGLGVRGFYTPASGGYGTPVSEDLRLLSVLTQCRVLSRTTSLPGSPTDGDIYIIPDGDTDEKKVAARDNGAWVLYDAAEGFLVYVMDDDEYRYFDGTNWSALPDQYLPDAPSDGSEYVRKDGAWAIASSASGGATVREFTGTADTAVLADANNIISANNAAAMTGTIPDEATVAYPVGTVLTYVNTGAGILSLVGDAGVTVNPPPGFTLDSAGQWAVLSATKMGSDLWVVTGHVEAV